MKKTTKKTAAKKKVTSIKTSTKKKIKKKSTDKLMNELIKFSFENGTFSGTPKKKRDSNFKKIKKIEKELLRREKRESISDFKLSQESINEILDDLF